MEGQKLGKESKLNSSWNQRKLKTTTKTISSSKYGESSDSEESYEMGTDKCAVRSKFYPDEFVAQCDRWVR